MLVQARFEFAIRHRHEELRPSTTGRCSPVDFLCCHTTSRFLYDVVIFFEGIMTVRTLHGCDQCCFERRVRTAEEPPSSLLSPTLSCLIFSRVDPGGDLRIPGRNYEEEESRPILNSHKR